MTIFLETPRLILKSPQWSDLDDLIALRTDPKVMQYTGQGRPQTKEEVEQFLTIAMAYQEKHGFGFCSVRTKDTGKFIGQAGLFHVRFEEDQTEIELAYRLHPQYWGHGYATELANALIDWGFTHLPQEKLIAFCDPDNPRSQNVLKKAGMWLTGNTLYQKKEVQLYAIYKKDKIELSTYDERWLIMAEKEIAFLRTLFPNDVMLDIQHVGSTSIPGMIAKPIIDIQIGVKSLTTVKPIAIALLEANEYVYWADNPDPERLFFVKGMPPYGEKRSHHIHICEIQSKSWSDKLNFRDFLRTHPSIAQQYADLKKELAAVYPYNREYYTKEKQAFIQDILNQRDIRC